MSDKKDHKIKVVNIRLVKEPSLYSPDPIKSPEDVVKVIAKELATYDREVFLVLNLKLNGHCHFHQYECLQCRNLERLPGKPQGSIQVLHIVQCRCFYLSS